MGLHYMLLPTLGVGHCPTRATEDYPACAKRITTDSTIHSRSPSSYLYLFFLADTLIIYESVPERSKIQWVMSLCGAKSKRKCPAAGHIPTGNSMM